MKPHIAAILATILACNTCHSEPTLGLDDRFTIEGCRIAGKARNARNEAIRHEAMLLAAHNHRKARVAYLISYIQSTGNAIDRLDPELDTTRITTYWHYILDAQIELLGLYHTELQFATDQDTRTILHENITKIERGRAFAKATLNRYGADWPTP